MGRVLAQGAQAQSQVELSFNSRDNAQPGEKFFDFNKIRDEIVSDTEAKTGKCVLLSLSSDLMLILLCLGMLVCLDQCERILLLIQRY